MTNGASKLVFLTLFVLGACSHPMMKVEDEPLPLQTTPTPSPRLSKKVTEPKTDTVPLPPEIFDTDDIHFELIESEWKLIGSEDGIKAYQRQPGRSPFGDIVVFRGETVIPARLTKIATVLNDPKIQKEWVDSLEEARFIERKSSFDTIGYNKTNVPWPFQDRDFVYRITVKVQVDPPTMLIRMKSIEDSREPPHEGVVRGEILLSYFYMKELPGGKSTKMVIEMAVDPKGEIPLWLVTASQKKWPHNTLKKLRELALRDSIPIAPEIQEYFAKKPAQDKKGKK